MRRDHGAARVAVAGVGATLLVVAAVVVPVAAGAPRPVLADLAVTLGLGAGAVRLVAAGRHRPAAGLGLAAALWTLTGLAASLPVAWAAPVSRLVLVPHALLVVTLAASLLRSWRWVAAPALPATVAAVAAGAGVGLPVLALLGAALLVAAAMATDGTTRVRAATAALGAAFVLADQAVLGQELDPRLLATMVDLGLLGIAAVAVGQATADVLRLVDVASDEPDRDEVAAWLAGVLGEPRLQVAFPAAGGLVDARGNPQKRPPDAGAVRDTDGGVVAYVTPAMDVEHSLQQPLVTMLRRLGEVARLRSECREQADAVARSRGRLQAAADEESRRLQRRLDETLVARLDRIEEFLQGSSGSALTERVRDVRVELLRHARGLDPLAGRSLADALVAHRARGVRVDVGDLGEVDPSSARTAWYVATEGITNATKHAPDSAIALEARRERDILHVAVRDDGPGGADVHGAGLQGLADRVAAAGGDLTVVSGPDGTRLLCKLPGTGYPAPASREIADPMLAGRS